MPSVLSTAVHAAALHDRAAHRRKREVALAGQRADAVLQLRRGRMGGGRHAAMSGTARQRDKPAGRAQIQGK